MIDFTKLQPLEAEEFLRDKLKAVEWIGQLALQEKDFHALGQMIRNRFLFQEYPFPKLVPSAVFLTSMVFTARYSNENVRNFWKPYACLVWKQDKASQTFQNQCRRKFRSSIATLKQDFDFHFPQKSGGDVVRPIYRHAIIPYYLQDDFAEWLKARWKEILEIPPQVLVAQLRFDRSVEYLPVPLQRFFQSKETAASMLAEGQDVDTIDTLLASNPIEHALWQELVRVYQTQETAVLTKKRKPIIEWLWSIQNHEMQLRIRNLSLNNTEQPDRIVWIYGDQSPEDAENESRLLPWRQADGWFVDPCVLSLGPPKGQIVLLGDRGSVLRSMPVPELPSDQPVMIFRITNNNEFGQPIDLNVDSISSGSWLVSMSDDVRILNASGEMIRPKEEFPVPIPLNKVAGHSSAGLYELNLPIRIIRRKLQLAKLESKSSTLMGAKLTGNSSNTIGNLSDSVPPVFNSAEIWLEFNDPSGHVLRRGTLWLHSVTEDIHHRLDTLQTKGALQVNGNQFKIALRDLLPVHAGAYQIQIRIGLRPLFPTSLEFGYLPEIRIEPPDHGKIFSPQLLPSCRIYGLRAHELQGRLTTKIVQKSAGVVEISWTDLRDDPIVVVQKDQERIPLMWDVARVNAWVTPQQEDYALHEFSGAKLHAESSTQDVREFQVWVKDQNHPRRICLDAKGQYNTSLRRDPIIDLVREHPSGTIDLKVQMGDAQWDLARVYKQIQIEDAEVEIECDESQNVLLEFRCRLQGQWSGETRFVASSLSNPDRQITIGRSDVLASRQDFLCSLALGYYQLQVFHHGKPLLSPPLAFCVGLSSEKRSLDLEELQPYLGASLERALPFELQNEYLRFSVACYAREKQCLPPECRYRLAVMPGKVFIREERSSLNKLWPVMATLQDAHRGRYSLRHDGLFPAWVVLDRPIHMKLFLPRKHVNIQVIPEQASYQGRHGIGFTFLKVRGKGAEADGILVRWDIVPGSDQYDVFLGLPDALGSRNYADLDEDEVWPLKQCNRCGDLIITRRTKRDEYLYEMHKHGRDKPDLIDITYDLDLLAQISTNRMQGKLKYKGGPDDWIDRSRVVQMARRGTISIMKEPCNPISIEGYQFAMARMNNQKAKGSKSDLSAWFSNRKWQSGLRAFEDVVMENKTEISAHSAAKRMLQAMNWDSNLEWINIDKQIFLLALMLRGQAYYRTPMALVFNEIGLRTTDLMHMLDRVTKIAPELLNWGMAWAEMMFVHTRN